jgi:hypothetical protein
MLQDSVVRSKSSADRTSTQTTQATAEENSWRISGRVFSTNEGRTWSLGLSAPTEFWKGLGSRVLIKIEPDGVMRIAVDHLPNMGDGHGAKVFGTGGTRQVVVAFNKIGARNFTPKTDATFKFLTTKTKGLVRGQLPEELIGIPTVETSDLSTTPTVLKDDPCFGPLTRTAPPIKPYTDFGTLQKAVAEVNRQLQVLGIDPDVSMVDGKVELRVRLR